MPVANTETLASGELAQRADSARLSNPPSVPEALPAQPAREIGGPMGPEPTRYGDWELRGRCIDF